MSVTLNRIGLARDAYKGAATTLCAGRARLCPVSGTAGAFAS